ncbi:hypothetical protein NTE_01362 [Candidatus Nitrososphaera evergladensis SR1]|uniref:HEPN domain-containing protein n=1 Tax=Candidatus Nitrososphaera evergladensis SR1 TaxID=1459636 RepID=A0A075MQR5_9ARCH|nr:HEPN domain-containing protein [Candidatus Nitrososphaera evergladensis]AIF83430.1 hypothetical protein NTE_01362 [Candidatus Nitrososphaera evergladensis SR1]
MLWYDFLTQAKKDMYRARLLHLEADYGFAAYSCQQGLEKYLKAYLLKHKAIEKARDISHADMTKLFYIIDKKVKAFLDKHRTTPIVSDVILQDAKKKLNDLLEALQPNQKVNEEDRLMTKTQLWKYSLQQPVDQSYESRFRIKKELLKESLGPVGLGFKKNFENAIIHDLARIPTEYKRITAQRYTSESSHFSKSLIQLIEGKLPEFSAEESNRCMIAFMEYMEAGLKKGGYYKTADVWLERKMIYLLVYPYDFYTSITKTYPHEDIGRYPTPIGEKSSLDLYPLYAENLSSLISEVESDCAKIENAIYGKWDKA